MDILLVSRRATHICFRNVVSPKRNQNWILHPTLSLSFSPPPSLSLLFDRWIIFSFFFSSVSFYSVIDLSLLTINWNKMIKLLLMLWYALQFIIIIIIITVFSMNNWRIQFSKFNLYPNGITINYLAIGNYLFNKFVPNPTLYIFHHYYIL